MRTYNIIQTDILIIGAGLTGLRSAIAAAQKHKKVIVVSKGPRCSFGVMAFNAPVDDLDNEGLYYSDIIASGKGLSDPALARIMACDSLRQKNYLEGLGMRFDRGPDGKYDLLQPLGCSRPRCVHMGRETGIQSEKRFLETLQNMGVSVSFDTTVLDLLSDGKRVYGALAVQSGDLCCFASKAVIMATGGCGDIFPISTYPKGIEGDGYAMAARAGAELVDMEMLQFEPCCLAKPDALKGKGISTTMLNAGAKLLNGHGEEFLYRYFDDTSKIQKSSLSIAMYNEILRCGGRNIRFDLSALPPDELEIHCLWIKELREHGIDPAVTSLSVCPAAHTFLGGVRVNSSCEASIKGLFAAGEAMGGLHGANRLGGCAGAETYVFGTVAGDAAAESCKSADMHRAAALANTLLEGYEAPGPFDPVEASNIGEELRSAVGSGLNIIRNESGILDTCAKVESLVKRAEALKWSSVDELVRIVSLQNTILVARLISEASHLRKESRGVFFRSDYPEEDPKFEKNTVIRLDNGIINTEL